MKLFDIYLILANVLCFIVFFIKKNFGAYKYYYLNLYMDAHE